MVFGEDHLRYSITQFVDYYHIKWSHRGLDYRTPKQVETGDEAAPLEKLSIAALRLRESLGGALRWYERKAA